MLESVIVSYDDTNGKDNTILLVGRQRINQTVEVINAFQGKEAEELYKKLTTVKPKNKERNEGQDANIIQE